MSEIFNIFDKDKAGLIDFYSAIKRGHHADWWPSDTFVRNNIVWLDRVDPAANFRFKYIRCTSDPGDTVQTEVVHIGVKLSAPDATRACFIKVPATVRIRNNVGYTPVETETLILAHAANVAQGVTLNGFPTGNVCVDTIISRNGSVSHVESSTSIRDSLKSQWINSSGTTIPDWAYWKMSGDGTGGVTHRYWTASQKNAISTKFSQICDGITYGLSGNIAVMTDYPYWETQYASTFNGYALNRYETDYLMTYDELPFPLFDYTQVADIIKYINTGDKSGALDVFDNENPPVERIENYKTNQKLYISQNTKTNNKYSYEFLNADYNKLDQVNRDDYECAVYDGTRIKATSSPSPVVTINKDITTSAAGDYIAVSWLGDKDQTQADANRSGSFKVWYKPKKASNVGIQIDRVEWATDPNGTEGWEVCGKSSFDGGYIYTAESGETLTVYFRAITMDDINEDFGDDPDHEDDETGTTPTIPTGRGIGTYNISASQLSAINDALWSYDWNSFFKSSTIDPVKCIISCKSVPFSVAGSGSEEIVIASMRTDVYAGQVNPSYRGDTISVTMPFYRGDFTDIEYTQVRVYLPYIGWVELPASEVMSRRAKLDVGLAGNTKVLKFRYLADLVDGSCTCVVSVNGTERWLFNGHCGIDIPITSDNHTNSINNAMHAGVQTVLNIGTAAAGALTDNAMMTAGGVISAISSAANVVPTYNYSASASPGGYINAALNTHIMIVIERPNVKYDDNVIKRLGKPCHKVLNLGSLRGFTKCGAVRIEGIDATPDELAMIASGLEAGVIL